MRTVPSPERTTWAATDRPVAGSTKAQAWPTQDVRLNRSPGLTVP